MWKRIAGGLSARSSSELLHRGRAVAAAAPEVASSRARPQAGPQELREYWQLMASCERLAAEPKAELGNALLPAVAKGKATEAEIWALGRLGARAPFYGPLNCVVARDDRRASGSRRCCAREWTQARRDRASPLVQLARCVGDRERDLDDGLRRRLAERLRSTAARRARRAPGHRARAAGSAGARPHPRRVAAGRPADPRRGHVERRRRKRGNLWCRPPASSRSTRPLTSRPKPPVHAGRPHRDPSTPQQPRVAVASLRPPTCRAGLRPAPAAHRAASPPPPPTPRRRDARTTTGWRSPRPACGVGLRPRSGAWHTSPVQAPRAGGTPAQPTPTGRVAVLPQARALWCGPSGLAQRPALTSPSGEDPTCRRDTRTTNTNRPSCRLASGPTCGAGLRPAQRPALTSPSQAPRAGGTPAQPTPTGRVAVLASGPTCGAGLRPAQRPALTSPSQAPRAGGTPAQPTPTGRVAVLASGPTCGAGLRPAQRPALTSPSQAPRAGGTPAQPTPTGRVAVLASGPTCGAGLRPAQRPTGPLSPPAPTPCRRDARTTTGWSREASRSLLPESSGGERTDDHPRGETPPQLAADQPRTALTSRNSSKPCSPHSRPLPDCL